MRGGVRVRPVARSGVYTQGAFLHECVALPLFPPRLSSSFRQFVSHGMFRRLEPFTPCWVSHRNLLKARFHPRGTNHRRDNPGRTVRSSLRFDALTSIDVWTVYRWERCKSVLWLMDFVNDSSRILYYTRITCIYISRYLLVAILLEWRRFLFFFFL